MVFLSHQSAALRQKEKDRKTKKSLGKIRRRMYNQNRSGANERPAACHGVFLFARSLACANHKSAAGEVVVCPLPLWRCTLRFLLIFRGFDSPFSALPPSFRSIFFAFLTIRRTLRLFHLSRGALARGRRSAIMRKNRRSGIYRAAVGLVVFIV